MVGGDHPESDTSEFCDQDQTKQYQTIVGQLIWLSGLGRFDIAVHVMTMSRFRQQPRIGHLERLKKIVGYLANFPHHDQVTGKAVTACLHIVNATPSHWYTKRQATVETATY